MSSEFAANGGIHGSLTGISIGVGVSSTQKVWRSLQAFGDIAFAYSSNILIEIQVRHDQGAATIGGEGDEECNEAERGDDNGFGFYESFWLLDVANVSIVVHLVGAYQVFIQPIFVFVKR
ncbi:hypothetical protein OsI_29240 [Oryza sativa Indica Group]|uniref:Uncharacterized protein n=1 Tax=Oryza sativa subsp. indica TaxID=39946 RepID=B8BAS8_ORYSI|nr:hypothetical protein OsI_29240 [Oryza sativa Indica Group]